MINSQNLPDPLPPLPENVLAASRLLVEWLAAQYSLETTAPATQDAVSTDDALVAREAPVAVAEVLS